MQRLMIVVPCYNEEEILPYSIEKLTGVIKNLIKKSKIASNSGILFVNDGSKDKTWEIIQNEYAKNPYVYGLGLAGNVGHQNALFAGLQTAAEICDFSISIDADLQDDIEVIEQMVDEYLSGADIVYGVRSERKTDTFFKRFTAQSFYRIMEMMGVKTVYNHADFRLMSARAMKQLGQYKERNLFLRGMVPLIGYKTATVTYARKERLAGESKYPLKKMLSFAWDGITSFSIKPISMIMAFGGVIVACSVIAFIYTLVSYFMGHVSPGWSSLMISIWFLGGVQLLFIGVVGQYVGKTYIESKERPRYNVEKFLNHEE
ncbi:MAG: glycosyltransferase family 2 protein [Oliverpabstia intestinalis]|uniref:Glycosyltransferase family 2 protein n=3 Tax=Oliverpabstia TaxID=2815777 RepID=A0A7X2P5E6_9FIRM|nr:glycosyltransferase family 2 protein [Oliverpabstia intestinalis]MDY5789980.1 glycosyltransferase family 2 protein [Oliverpabstia intestinalis]MST67829.1 glycosyltransferase family 2 protein [Oliverpabstia intestinalis]